MVQCQRCKQEGHSRARCPDVFCGGCRQQGHRPSACPNRPTWKCTACGGIGHAQWECTQMRPEEIPCSLCRELGHLAKKCPNRGQWFCKKCKSLGHGYWECENQAKPQKNKKEPPPTQPNCSTCGDKHANSPNSCPSQPRASADTSAKDDHPSSTPLGNSNARAPEPEKPEPPKKEKPTPSEWVQKLVGIGDRWFTMKNYETAVSFFSKAIDLETRVGSIYAKRGFAYAFLKKDREALSDLNSAAKDDFYVATVEFHIHSARCRLRLGSLAAAMHALRDAKSVNPYHSDVSTLQARLEDLERFRARYECTSAADNWRAAKVAYESCLEIYKLESCKVPVDVQRWGVEIMITEGTQLEQAKDEIEKLLEDARPSEILFLSALILFLQDKLTDCLAQLRDILISDPDYSEAQSLRTCVKRIVASREKATAFSKSKNWLDAREEYTSALTAMKPYERRASGGTLRAKLSMARATVLKEMGQYEGAVKDINVCLSILPEDFEAVYLRGRVFINLELYDSAVIDLAAAMERAPPFLEDTIQAQLKAAEFKRNQSRDFYKILGLAASCTRAEIKRAYRVESLKHHPDKGGLPERFNAVAEAYETLSDEVKRAAYDSGRTEQQSWY